RRVVTCLTSARFPPLLNASDRATRLSAERLICRYGPIPFCSVRHRLYRTAGSRNPDRSSAFATQHSVLTLTPVGQWGSGPMLHPSTQTNLALEGNQRWYLVHTLPHCERRAQLHLGAQGFRTHFPTIQKTIRHARQLRTVRAPLFPRYVFLILDLGRDRWLSVWGTAGVSSLYSCGDRPVPVPEGIVET